MEARNPGSGTPDASAHGLFCLDGAESMALGLAFGNGARLPAWSALAPGQTVDDTREVTSFIHRPGRHTFAYCPAPSQSGSWVRVSAR